MLKTLTTGFDEFPAAIERFGGVHKATYALVGRFDAAVVAEFPERSGVLAFVLLATSAGQAVEVLPAFERVELEAAEGIAREAGEAFFLKVQSLMEGSAAAAPAEEGWVMGAAWGMSPIAEAQGLQALLKLDKVVQEGLPKLQFPIPPAITRAESGIAARAFISATDPSPLAPAAWGTSFTPLNLPSPIPNPLQTEVFLPFVHRPTGPPAPSAPAKPGAGGTWGLGDLGEFSEEEAARQVARWGFPFWVDTYDKAVQWAAYYEKHSALPAMKRYYGFVKVEVMKVRMKAETGITFA